MDGGKLQTLISPPALLQLDYRLHMQAEANVATEPPNSFSVPNPVTTRKVIFGRRDVFCTK
jgi:hypothetical protein